MSEDIYILSSADITEMKQAEKSHFLNQKARRKEKSLGAATGLNEIDFSMSRLIRVMKAPNITFTTMKKNVCLFLEAKRPRALVRQAEWSRPVISSAIARAAWPIP